MFVFRGSMMQIVVLFCIVGRPRPSGENKRAKSMYTYEYRDRLDGVNGWTAKHMSRFDGVIRRAIRIINTFVLFTRCI